MTGKIKTGIRFLKKSDLFTNSFWGIMASALQNLFLSAFYVLIARIYVTEDFAHYLIAIALYQLLAVFSTFGLGSWFIREIVNTDDREDLVNSFFKIQLFFGITFYLVNLVFAFALYDNSLIHTLAFIYGFNIILDNLIYAIKSLNTAESQQIKTFKIQIIDSFLLFVSAAVLLIYPFSIIWLAIIQVLVRTFTINLFLRIGSSDLVNVQKIAKYKVQFIDIKKLIYMNWTFVIIGSISLIYWRSADIIVSKMLSFTDVAIYGISYKIFQLALIIPFILATTVYPSLVKKFNNEKLEVLKSYYENVFLFYFAYGLLAYTFIYSFADLILPLIFGGKYNDAGTYTRLMFLTILVFPTALLQANLLVAIKLEKFDMIFNIISLLLYLLFTFVGLYFIKSLMIVNYSIFASFLIFHFLQDVLLIKRNIVSIKHAITFYFISSICIGSYFFLVNFVGLYLSFIIIWPLIGLAFAFFSPNAKKFLNNLFFEKKPYIN